MDCIHKFMLNTTFPPQESTDVICSALFLSLPALLVIVNEIYLSNFKNNSGKWRYLLVLDQGIVSDDNPNTVFKD